MENIDLILSGGAENAAKKKALKAALLKIEEKHINYFKSKPAKYPFEKHERLHNHFSGTDWFHREMMIQVPESDLPQEIVNECANAFNEIWNKQ